MGRLTRWSRWGAGALLVSVAALNGIVWAHARSFLYFEPPGERTASPEALSGVERVAVLLTGVSLPRPTLSRTPGDLGLPFTTERFPTTEGETLEAWWLPQPGPPVGRVLVFHGYGAARDSLLEVGAWWHARGWEVALVDCRGAGGSTGDHTTLGWKEADDVAATVAAARARGPEPVVLYGFSMGGAAVLGALGRLGVEADGAVVEASYATMSGTVANRFRLMGLPPTPLSDLLVFWGGVVAGFDGFALRPVDDAAVIRVPVLVLHGADDERAPSTSGEALVAALGDHGRLVVFPRTAHQPGLMTRPPEWGAAVTQLIRQVEVGGGQSRDGGAD